MYPERSAEQIRNMHLNPYEGLELAEQLSQTLDRYQDRRVLVLGSPCAGKSTLLQHIPGIDMDIVFDTMPDDFKHYVLHHEHPVVYLDGDREIIKYTERPYIAGNPDSEAFLRHTGNLLQRYTNENLAITPGYPVFGTSLIDTDVIVHLALSDEALDARIASRNAKTFRPVQASRIYALRDIINEQVESARASGAVVETFYIGE